MFLKWFKAHYKGVLIHSIPNGGFRNSIEAKKLKDEGIVPGIPDIFVPKFNLWVEMKREEGGVLSKVQKDIIFYLEEETTHSVIVGHGAIDAITKVKEFLNGKIH